MSEELKDLVRQISERFDEVDFHYPNTTKGPSLLTIRLEGWWISCAHYPGSGFGIAWAPTEEGNSVIRYKASAVQAAVKVICDRLSLVEPEEVTEEEGEKHWCLSGARVAPERVFSADQISRITELALAKSRTLVETAELEALRNLLRREQARLDRRFL